MKKFLCLLVLSTLVSVKAVACTCEQWESAQQILKSNGMVFLGVPEVSKKVTPGNPPENPIMKTKFTVVRGFKNVSAREVEVYSIGGEGGSCEIEWTSNGGVWLIMASRENGKLQTSSCQVMSSYPSDEDPYDTYFAKIVRDLTRLSNH